MYLSSVDAQEDDKNSCGKRKLIHIETFRADSTDVHCIKAYSTVDFEIFI